MTQESLEAKPFHIYDNEFYDVIGKDPSLTLIATSDTDPIFHEAVVWYPPRDEVFFVQNAGAPAAGTGLNKSSIIQKISLAEAEAVRRGERANATVTIVPSHPQVINPNGMPLRLISHSKHQLMVYQVEQITRVTLSLLERARVPTSPPRCFS